MMGIQEYGTLGLDGKVALIHALILLG